MNSRFLASRGGRFAHGALTLAIGMVAFAAASPPTASTYRWLAAGTLVVIAGFIVAAVLSAAEFTGYTLLIAGLAPLAGFYYVCGALFVMGKGATLGSAIGTVALFVFAAGILLGLRSPAGSPRAASKVGHAATAER